jgi:hypothetical protein
LDTWDRVRIFTMLMQLSITVKIKVMTVNPTLNNHLLLENRLNQLLRDGQLSKDVWNDLIDCVTLHRQLEFKQLTINK